MDVIVIILVILAVIVMIFKKFSSFVYYVCLVDIFLRILDFLAANIPLNFLSNFINTYFPNSVFNIVEMYTDGIFTTVLIWLLVLLYAVLDFYLIRTFWKKN